MGTTGIEHPEARVTLRRVGELIAVLPGFRGGAVAGDDTVDRLGLDSLDRLELLVAIEDAFGVMLHDDYLSASTTVEDLVRAIDRR